MDPLLLAPVILIVICGPIWLLYQYFLGPSRQAARLKEVLPPQRQFSIDPQTLWVITQGREIALPFSRMKAVVETDALFMLVLSPFSFSFVPSSGLPAAAYSLLHERAQSNAA
jgi:hypothetical protein